MSTFEVKQKIIFVQLFKCIGEDTCPRQESGKILLILMNFGKVGQVEHCISTTLYENILLTLYL